MTSTTRLPAVRAALAGLIAVIAALGAGHLVSGLVLAPAASPFLAVGNATIDRTPAPVKDFAITYFGTNDKPALLVGMAVVLVAFGLLVGLISRRSAVPGLAAICVLGVVGALAVYEQSADPLGLLAPLASLVVGVGVFWWLHRQAQPRRAAVGAEAEGAGDAPVTEVGRRRFVLNSLAAAV
ncbi:MAG: molybdopterin-binding protein, partial [Mycobacterium sp.]